MKCLAMGSNFHFRNPYRCWGQCYAFFLNVQSAECLSENGQSVPTPFLCGSVPAQIVATCSRRQQVTNQRGAKRGKAAQAQTEALQLWTLMLTAALTQEQRLLQNVPNVAASPTPQHAFLLGPPPRR